LSDKEKTAFRKKALIFSFFLLLSVVFWFMNALSKNYTTDIKYPVVYRKFPDDKILTGELPEYLTLNVNAHGYTLLRYSLGTRHIPLVFNVRSFYMNQSTRQDSSLYYIETRYARDYFAKQLSSEFQIIDIKPDSLYFRFARVVSKKVPVQSDLKYSLDKQLILKRPPEIVPDSVLVSGPDYVLDTLFQISTKLTDLGLIKQTTDKKVDLLKVKNTKLMQEQVTVKFDVEKFTEKTLQIPIEVLNMPDTTRLKTFPNIIKVTCQVGLSEYEKLQPSMFTAIVDFTEAQAGLSNKIIVELTRQPEFIKSLKYSPRTVEYLIENQ
jgi:hypothetical protein